MTANNPSSFKALSVSFALIFLSPFSAVFVRIIAAAVAVATIIKTTPMIIIKRFLDFIIPSIKTFC